MKKVYTIFGLFLIIIGTIAGILKITQNVLAQSSPRVYIDPSNQTGSMSGTIPVSVNAQNMTNVGAYEFTLSFNPQVLEVQSAVDGGWLDDTGRTVNFLAPVIDSINGTVKLGAYTTYLPYPGPDGPNGNGTLANMTFNVIGAGQSNLILTGVNVTDITGTSQGTIIVDNGIVDVPAPSPTPVPTPTPASTPTPLPTPTPSPTLVPTPTPLPTPNPSPTPTPSVTPMATPTPTPSATPVATPSPTPTPITATPTPTLTPSVSPTPAPTPAGTAQLVLSLENKAFVNEEFTVDLSLSTDTEIIGVDAKVLFDPTKLVAIKIDDQHLLSVTPAADFNNGNGIVRISQAMDPGKTYQGTGIMAKIVFKSLVTGVRTLKIDYVQDSTIDSNVVTPEGEDILQEPQDLSFEVIDHADLVVTLTTPSKNGYDYTGTVYDDQSIWTSRFTTDTQGLSNTMMVDDGFIGQLKSFFIKVSGFLRRKASTTVNSGHNQLDAGYLKAGDLNDDSIINNADLGIMYGVWYGIGTADYNRDGEVNVFDYLLLTQNFLQTDE